MVRDVPVFHDDAEAEAFLDQDLSDLNFSQFQLLRETVAEPQDHLDLALPRSLLKALQDRAEAVGTSTALYIKDLLERAISS
jgi:predicted DNA binding CopG/RHH family protein